VIPVEGQIVVPAFAFIGGGLKYIDEAFDEDLFDKKKAGLLAVVLTVLWIGISIHDPISATILFAVLAGVLFSGKIDNLTFKAATILIIMAIVGSGRFELVFWVFAALFLTGVLDEKGNDFVDTHRVNRFMEFFFLHRFSMKVGVLAVCAASLIPWTYLLAFLAFDLAYDSIGYIGQGYAARVRPVRDLSQPRPPITPLKTWPILVAC